MSYFEENECPEPDMPHETCVMGHYLSEYETVCPTCRYIEAEDKLAKVTALEKRLKDAEEIIKMQAQYYTHINGSMARSYLKKYGVKWNT